MSAPPTKPLPTVSYTYKCSVCETQACFCGYDAHQMLDYESSIPSGWIVFRGEHASVIMMFCLCPECGKRPTESRAFVALRKGITVLT